MVTDLFIDAEDCRKRFKKVKVLNRVMETMGSVLDKYFERLPLTEKELVRKR